MVSPDPTKRRIIEAAGAVFAESGFESATVREICRRAGVNLAAVNYHFGDKRRLYVEAVKWACTSRAEAVPLPDWRPATPAVKRLGDFIRTLLERMIGEGNVAWQSQLMLREMSRPDSASEELVRDYIRPHFDILLGILNELVPPAMSELKRHWIAFSVVGQCLHYRVAQPVVRLLVSRGEYAKHYNPAQLADHITSFVLAALGHTSLPASGNGVRQKNRRSSATRSRR